jgi:hypothetical protein
MKTPGVDAVKLNEKLFPGITSRNARLGAMRAAWKSMEWGIVPPLVSVICTICP